MPIKRVLLGRPLGTHEEEHQRLRKTIGDLVAAQSQAVPEALMRAGRPVRTIDLDRLDPAAVGALLMSMMIETILAARLFGVDAFDQPAVELAKNLTRERLAAS